MGKSIVDILNESSLRVLDSANQSEAEVMRQVVVIDTGALALIGVFVSLSTSSTLTFKVLMTVSATLLFASLLTAVIHFVSTHTFYLSTFRKLTAWRDAASKMDDEKKAREYAEKNYERDIRSSSPAPYWISLICLLGAALTIAILILINVWI